LVNRTLVSSDNPRIFRGDLDLSESAELASLGKIEIIYGDVHFSDCVNLYDLGSLTQVYGMLDLSGCSSLNDLGNLRFVKGSLNLSRTGVSRYPSGLIVGWNFVGRDGWPVRAGDIVSSTRRAALAPTV